MCLRYKGITKIWPWAINLQQSTEYQNYKAGSQFSKGDKDVQGLTFFHPQVTHLGFHFKIEYNGVAYYKVC